MLKKTRNRTAQAMIILILCCIVVITSCGKPKTLKPDEDSLWKQSAPLEKIYKKIIIQKFEIDQDLEKDLPEAALICESSVMNELLKKDVTSQIEKSRLSMSREAGALIVKARITTLRLTGNIARGPAAAASGNAEMAADVKLIDAETGKTLRKKNLSTADQPTSPSSSAAGSDRALPSELGKMIAEYVNDAVRGY